MQTQLNSRMDEVKTEQRKILFSQTHYLLLPLYHLLRLWFYSFIIGFSNTIFAFSPPETTANDINSSSIWIYKHASGGAATLPYEQHFSPFASWDPNHDLIIEGNNPSNSQALLIIRLDDANSTGYSTRVNQERYIAPGPFLLRITLASLLTPEKKHLELHRLRALYLFTAQPRGVSLNHISLQHGMTFEHGVIAWDFGNANHAPFSGFTRIGAQDQHLQGRPTVTTRSGSFAPFNDGLRGVDQINIPLPAGQYQLRLWNRDPGEWEFLPHPQERRVRVNGATIWEQRLTPEQWTERIYLAGRHHEAIPSHTRNIQETAAQQLMLENQGKLSAHISHPGGNLVIDLAGDSPDAQYISALLLWPDIEQRKNPDALPESSVPHHSQIQYLQPTTSNIQTPEEHLTQRLMRLFYDNWHINPTPQVPEQAISLTLPTLTRFTGQPATSSPTIMLGSTVSNSHLSIDLKLDTSSLQQANKISLHLSPFIQRRISPKHTSNTSTLNPAPTLPAELRWGQWHWVRQPAQGYQLIVSSGYLRTDLESIPLDPISPRYLHVFITVPKGTPAGEYQATLTINMGEQSHTYPFLVRVLPIQLPDATLPIGVYLDVAPHLTWFDTEQATQQSSCDLRWLAHIGLSVPAPVLATPDDQHTAHFEQDLHNALQSNHNRPLLAYTPLKRLRDNLGDKMAIMHIAEIERDHPQALAWSLADEADSQHIPSLLHFAHALRARTPNIQLAGQLNHPSQSALLPALALVLINDGFGASAANIAQLKNSGKRVWLYNLGASRMAAGFYLWRSGAQGYLQWHARMPTADPLNPTDGREADFQFLYPPVTVCARPDTDRSLFMLLEGADDRRWLQLLDEQSKKIKAAQILRRKIWEQIPDNWQEAQQLSDEQLQQWRLEIQQLFN